MYGGTVYVCVCLKQWWFVSLFGLQKLSIIIVIIIVARNMNISCIMMGPPSVYGALKIVARKETIQIL